MGKFSIIRGQKVKGLPELLELAGRELRFYGITFFQVGIGFLVSVRLTQRAADGGYASPDKKFVIGGCQDTGYILPPRR